ncbi:hypothetical protein [Paractinoplanes hotanensis]|uniref:Uncharacterized protein n=1 Tax=Paractinoplanes hotanensis TaxID=2906497 RepID=A0ABT0YCF5_9ACTN|nr:hypothetical protein [Actinoplanes hotanensis]MCM4083729.1 hypothetical protein [Actinoplanes hotanensis]
MTNVARVLPGDWDGHRLLRFLTGLAMLALAFAAHLTPAHLTPAHLTPADPAPASAVVAVQSEPAVVAAQTEPTAVSAAAQSQPGTASAGAAAQTESSPAEAAAGVESLSSPRGLSAHWVMLVVAAPMAPAVALLTTVAAIVLISGLAVRTYAVRGPPLR